jgi:hypothetical protein
VPGLQALELLTEKMICSGKGQKDTSVALMPKPKSAVPKLMVCFRQHFGRKVYILC